MPSLLVDVVLLGVFAVQHSVMARQGFQRWWTQFVPSVAERSARAGLEPGASFAVRAAAANA